MIKTNLSIIICLVGLSVALPLAVQASSVINNFSTNQKVVALTFDADMTWKMKYELMSGKVKSLYDKKITDILIHEQIPATIFATGLWLETYSQEYEDLSKNKLFEFGNHSYSHTGFTNKCYKLGELPDDWNSKELSVTEDLLNKSPNHTTKLFRFPGLCYDQNDLNIIDKLGYNIIGGNLTNIDAFNKNSSLVSEKIINNITPGSIIVMHLNGGTNAPATAHALPTTINELKKRGYSFVKVSELINK